MLLMAVECGVEYKFAFSPQRRDGSATKLQPTLPVKFVICLPGSRGAPRQHPASSTYPIRSRRPCSASKVEMGEIGKDSSIED